MRARGCLFLFLVVTRRVLTLENETDIILKPLSSELTLDQKSVNVSQAALIGTGVERLVTENDDEASLAAQSEQIAKAEAVGANVLGLGIENYLRRHVARQARFRRGERVTLVVLRVQKCASTLLQQVFSPHFCRRGEKIECTTLRVFRDNRCHIIVKPGTATCWSNLYDYSFAEALGEGYGGSVLADKIRHAASRVRLVDGHLKFGIHRPLGISDERVMYVTSVREPVHRIVSQYNWWKEAWGFSLSFEHFIFNDTTFKNKQDFGGYMKSNHMVRVLCGRDVLQVATPTSSRPSGKVEGFQFAEDKSSLDSVPTLTQAHLECAKANLLKYFPLVIVSEDLKTSSGKDIPNIIHAAFGIPEKQAGMLLQKPHFKVTGRNRALSSDSVVTASTLTQAVLDHMHSMNRLDAELYHFAKALSRCQLAYYSAVLTEGCAENGHARRLTSNFAAFGQPAKRKNEKGKAHSPGSEKCHKWQGLCTVDCLRALQAGGCPGGS